MELAESADGVAGVDEGGNGGTDGGGCGGGGGGGEAAAEKGHRGVANVGGSAGRLSWFLF